MAARPRKPKKPRYPKPGVGDENCKIYLLQFSYTAPAWRDMVMNRHQRDRVTPMKKLIASFGGCFATITFECCDGPVIKEKFVGFGEYDVVTLVSFPNDEAAAAFAMMVSAGGGVKSFKTTRVLSWDQAMSAMARANTIFGSYDPPGKA